MENFLCSLFVVWTHQQTKVVFTRITVSTRSLYKLFFGFFFKFVCVILLELGSSLFDLSIFKLIVFEKT